MERKVDVYSEAVKTIVGYHKRSLLDFIDVIERSYGDSRMKDVLGRIKGRVHNDLSQCTLNLGILLVTMRSGGDIQPFEDNMIFKKDDSHRKPFDRSDHRYPENKIQKDLNNPVIKKEDGIKDKL